MGRSHGTVSRDGLMGRSVSWDGRSVPWDGGNGLTRGLMGRFHGGTVPWDGLTVGRSHGTVSWDGPTVSWVVSPSRRVWSFRESRRACVGSARAQSPSIHLCALPSSDAGHHLEPNEATSNEILHQQTPGDAAENPFRQKPASSYSSAQRVASADQMERSQRRPMLVVGDDPLPPQTKYNEQLLDDRRAL